MGEVRHDEAKPNVVTVVAVAGRMTPDGSVFPADALRSAADNAVWFWDERRKTLFYRGPEPVRRSM